MGPGSEAGATIPVTNVPNIATCDPVGFERHDRRKPTIASYFSTPSRSCHAAMLSLG